MNAADKYCAIYKTLWRMNERHDLRFVFAVFHNDNYSIHQRPSSAGESRAAFDPLGCGAAQPNTKGGSNVV